MRSAPSLGQIFGVRLRLHYTWLAAIILITTAVTTQFSTAYPLWQRITLGIAASLLFLTGITIREFMVSLTAASRGIPTKSITLFMFGGVSQTDRETTLPGFDLLLAVVGMLSNLIIAAIFYVVYFVLANTGSMVIHIVVQWLAFIYFYLTLFHFIPGLPLDGGRALRALLWKTTGNYELVTRITSWAGWGIGLVLTIWGILIMIDSQQWFIGLFLAFPGLVLQNAATHSRRQATSP